MTDNITNKKNQKFDLIIWGATSFVGEIICNYLVNNYTNIKWAIAGRNEDKLNTLKKKLASTNPFANNLTIYIGNSFDQDFLNKLTADTKVIISTIGPYLKYGEKLIKACINNNTDYCDLTGEVPFIKKMHDLYYKQAQKSNSRIIHCCGFDSIPSDLGVYYLNKQAKLKYNSPIISADCIVTKIKGGFSGGTIASIINMIDAIKSNKQLKSLLANPYCLCNISNNKSDNILAKQKKLSNYKYNKNINKWLTTFLMSAVNSKIVHQSNYLLNYPYCKEFQYTEFLLAKNYLNAISIYYGLNLMMLLLYFKPSRIILEKLFLPKPGQGPSLQQQLNGYFEFNIHGKTKNNHAINIQVTGNQDPGYGATAKMIVESALCLLNKQDRNKLKGGFWTPASALGDDLIHRLEQYAGMQFI